MSQTIDLRSATAATNRSLLAPIENELVQVEHLLRKELRSDAQYVDELLQYGCFHSGKRLRPALLLLAGQATGSLVDEHLVLAAVVEMIHAATLVHDDVLDEATLRRHVPTVNARWDNQASVLLGDFLFTHAFYLASTTDVYACQTIGRTTNMVCEGELRQVGHRGNFRLDEDEYMEIIEAKTAVLCACACRLGAYYSRAETEIVDRLARFGQALGTAFQIVDDLLDLQGDEQTMGKSLGTDLEKRKLTLPLICVLRRATPSERDQLIRMIETDDAETIRRELRVWFERFEAFAYTRQRADELVAQARQEIHDLPRSPAKSVLLKLTEFVVSRAH